MKKLILTLVVALCATSFTFAQSPEAFKYQAVARDNSGSILANQAVSFQISILQGSTGGSSVYTETHAITTNNFGLVNLEIGNGTLVSGDFTTIDWGANSYFVKIEMDETGGSSYQFMGTSQLMSVPYALYAETTGDTTKWQLNGNNLYYNQGKVGIGTNTPNSKLDINNSFISFSGNSSGLVSNVYPLGALKLFCGPSTGNISNGFWFRSCNVLGNPSSFTNLMHIMPNNIDVVRVGIGEMSPARNLHIKDVMRLEPRSSVPSSPSAGDIYFSSTTNKLMVYDGTTWQACW